MSIQLKSVSVRNAVTGGDILRDIRCSFEPGRITLVVGATGSGKSTLLETIIGLVRPSEGEVSVDGEPLWNGRRKPSAQAGKLSMVFQFPEKQLFADTVLQEFTYNLAARQTPPDAIRRIAVESLAAFGLPETLLEQSPLSLSGGERRRLGFALAFASQPHWLLLDEPTAGLDGLAAAKFVETLLGSELPGGFIIVTHDLDTFLPIADDVLVMSGGRIVASCSALQLMESPDLLLQYGVGLPESMEVIQALNGIGVPMPTQPFSAEEIAQAIYQWQNEAPQPVAPQPAALPPSPQLNHAGPDVFCAPSPLLSQSRLPIDTRVKWVGVVLLSLVVFLQTTWQGTAVAAAISAVTVCLCRVPLRNVWRLVRTMLILTLISSLLSGLRFQGANEEVAWHGLAFVPSAALETALQLSKLIVVLVIGGILPATSTQLEMKRALEQILYPLRGMKIPVGALSLGATLILRFVPVLGGEVQRFRRIAKSRRGGTKERFRARDMLAMVVPLVISLLQLGEDLTLALRARGYRDKHLWEVEKQTNSLTRVDALALMYGALAILLLVAMRIGLP